jgi:hypothetical protein
MFRVVFNIKQVSETHIFFYILKMFNKSSSVWVKYMEYIDNLFLNNVTIITGRNDYTSCCKKIQTHILLKYSQVTYQL